jgi:ATP-dependent DNA helicase DinG
MLCDPRLLSKGYGRIFLASLPPMPVTKRLEEVEQFFGRDPSKRKAAQKVSQA